MEELDIMGDVFKEQIVKRKATKKDTLMRVGLILAVFVVFFVSSIFLGGIGLYVAFAAGYGAYLLMGRLNVEYEYSFTNGELDIDIIYSKTRRKRLFSSHVNDFEIMAHTEDKTHMGDFPQTVEIKDFSSGDPAMSKYAFLLHQNGKATKVVWEPNESMLKALSSVLTPRKLFLKK
jgi:hypothetical protein